jgi:hypothetical protein
MPQPLVPRVNSVTVTSPVLSALDGGENPKVELPAPVDG